MGKVKTEQIKRVAKDLLARFPDKFTASFDENKRMVSVLTHGTTIKVRNQIAGYITHAYAIAAGASSEKAEEDEFETQAG